MFIFLLRKLWTRRRRSDTEKSSTSSTTSQELKFQETGPHIPDIIMTTTPYHDETDQIVNQLATLAATVSNTSSNSAPSSTAASIAEPQSAAPKPKLEQPEEEETFYHLRSLITVSCLPQHTSGHTPTPSTSTLSSKSGKRKSQIFDRKRASSILSLHLGDLPSLPFSSKGKIKGKVSRKPCPRYSPLPPPFVQKKLAIRPEVRF